MWHDFGETLELHALRQEWAIKLADQHKRHSAESESLHQDFLTVLRERGLSEREANAELFAMIRDATPLDREYAEGGE